MPELRDQLVSALAGRYDVERELGHGGMAYVFLARDLKHDRQVAIKVLKPELATTIGVERFLREIRITARLEHPNILRLYASDNVGEAVLYYVVQYVPGDTLRHKLDREAQLPLDEALAITRQVAAALDYAHAHGVIHRDIKPANILLHEGQAVVADFGLARMYDTTDTAPLTQSAMVIGTPAYMSPEQIAGDAELDGRTDIYSLACVFFEMVAGSTPFHAASRQALYGLHMTAPPPSLCAERENCPPEMDAAVQRALSKVPADRFRTAMDFVRALEGEATPTTFSSGKSRARLPAAGGRRWVIPAATAIAAGVVALAAARYLRPERGSAAPALGPSSIAILPFTSRSAGTDTTAITARMIEALDEWDGVELPDERKTREALAASDDRHLSLANATRIARTLGAARLVWGDVTRAGDTVLVRATMYDPVTMRALRTRTVSYKGSEHPPLQPFREIANSFLRDGQDQPLSAGNAGTQMSLAAWRAYDEGRASTSRWDLAGAADRFRAAVAADGDHAPAQLWLATVQLWAGRPTDDWRAAAKRAFELRNRLTPRDAALAEAQLALADGRFPEACAGYRRAIGLDTNDVAGWYGLGECQSRDDVVVPDKRSPSGYSFRSSLDRAVQAYVKIVDDVTSAAPDFVYRRLSFVLFPDGFHYRRGREIGGARRRFGGYPILQHDTLAFVPYPMTRFGVGGPGVVAHGKPDAIEHNRALLRRLYMKWLRDSPRNVEARIATATLLETTEQLKSGNPNDLSALNQIQEALRLSSDTSQRLLLARTRARLLVKSAEWSAVSRFADSLFKAVQHPAADTNAALVGVAALTGRIRTTAEILRARAFSGDFQFALPDGTPLELKPAVQEEVQTMFAYAALGACTDSLRRLPERMDRVLASYVADDRRRAIRDAVLINTLELAVPCVGPAVMKGIDSRSDQTVAMEQALARSDGGALRALFATTQAGRAADRPGDVAIEYTYIESWMLAQIGDTAAAIAHLDHSLDALPTLGRYLLDRPSQSAGLVRAMGLRAELASAAGDRNTALQWGSAVATLWMHADPELQPYVTKMRGLAAARP